MKSLQSRFYRIMAVACLYVAVGPAEAQLPRTITSTLTVKVQGRESPNSRLGPMRKAFVCVGDSTDTRRFGYKQMLNDSGEVRFDGIPLGANLVVTAFLEESLRRPPLGGRTLTNMRSTREVAEVHWNLWEGGPTCNTPVRSKPLPESVATPQLQGRLATTPGPLARVRPVELFSETGSAGNYLAVSGGATEYRTSQRSDFAGASWITAARMPGVQPPGIRPIKHEISGAAGRKTIYVQLRSESGPSPVYSVQVDFLDLYTCTLTYRRAPNATADYTMAEEQITLVRAQSKTLDVAWPSSNEGKPGYGMHLRRAYNTGEHPIELTVGGGLVWNTVVLQPGKSRYIRADMRAVRCP